MNRKIRVLIVTNLPWRGDNSIGNSYSNIFRDTEKDKYEFAQIYIRDGMPQNNIVHEYYHISEKGLMRHVLKPWTKVGKYFHLDDSSQMKKDTFGSIYNKARVLRWEIFFLFRELIGLTYCWKTPEFEKFLDEFNPDLVFGTLATQPVINRIMWYVSESRNIPLITYPWDDYYSLDHHSYSPIFWIRKFLIRHYLRKTARKSRFLYCISNLMIDEYSKEFGKECKLLFKGNDFDITKTINPEVHNPIRITYMGNIGGGRWNTLGLLAEAINQVNTELGRQAFDMNVYTLSPKTPEIEAALNIDSACKLNPSVPNDEVLPTMNAADILLHAEPLKKEEIQFFRASFSTKLVDYFYNAKCILAIGGMTASTDYLVRNNAAIVETDNKKLVDLLRKIASNPNILKEYALKSWECGVRNHQIKDIQKRMYDDFVNEIKK